MVFGTHTYWGMTLNNPSPEEMLLVEHGYPDYMRQIIHTLEQGKQGTPHLQCYIHMKRDQRLSFMKKLYPRGSFKSLTTDEWKFNTKHYAQKNDDTTRSEHRHMFYDPIETVETMAKRTIMGMLERDYAACLAYTRRPYGGDDGGVARVRAETERTMVLGNYRLAKMLSSQTYKKMWDDFGPEMVRCVMRETSEARAKEEQNVEASDESTASSASENICGQINTPTHTHTHTDGGGNNVDSIVQPLCPAPISAVPVVVRRVVRCVLRDGCLVRQESQNGRV